MEAGHRRAAAAQPGEWEQAFEAYKLIPQYQQLNAGMTLSDFKTIFWWEWSHRLLGRVIGVVYLLPFLYFLWRGGMSAELRRRLWLIFGLGALQGAVGWWMVASGLSERVEVSQYRLATHLVLALLIFAAIVWTLRRLGDRPPLRLSARMKITSAVLVVLTFVQLYLGALVAGLRAGLVYNTWPAIDGGFIPVERAAVVRSAMVAQPVRECADGAVRASHDGLCAVRCWRPFTRSICCARKRRAPPINGALWLLAAVTLQAVLGILTLLNQVPILLALSHQAVAIGVLTLAVLQAERLAARPAEIAAREIAAPAHAGWLAIAVDAAGIGQAEEVAGVAGASASSP